MIAWNWSWSHYEPDPRAVERLPADVIVMATTSAASRRRWLQYATTYSIGVVGPSLRFRGGPIQKTAARLRSCNWAPRTNPDILTVCAPVKIGEVLRALKETGVPG